MTFQTRRFLFYFFFAMFVAGGSALVFYSFGWRLTFENEKIKIQKIGALYIESKPKNATIKIDGEERKNESGLIQNGTLISGLPPKTYLLEISQESYRPWRKNIEVEPELVSEAINVILVPKEIKAEKIPLRLRGNEITDWSDGSEKFVLKDEKEGTYYLYDLNNPSSVFNVNFNFKNLKKNKTIQNISFHPFDAGKLIVEAGGELNILDISRLKLENVFSAPHSAWTVKNSNIYAASKNNISSFNLMLKNESVVAPLSTSSVAQKPIIKIEVPESKNDIAVLNEFDDLYVFDSGLNEFKKIAHNVKTFSISPDGKKIAFADKNENSRIYFYFLDDWQKNTRKKAGESANINLLKGDSEIKNIVWHRDSYHIFVEYEDENGKTDVDFVEIDDRKPLNEYKIFDDAADFHYDRNLNVIYFIKENSLYSFKFQY